MALESIANDMLHEILSLLTNAKDLAFVNCVSRKWYTMSEELLINTQLRENPHNAEAWLRRVRTYKGDLPKQIFAIQEGLRTVDPTIGEPHKLWVGYARLYETNGDISNARAIFEEAVQANFSDVDHLVTIWCERAEMEIRHRRFKTALNLIKHATKEPSPKTNTVQRNLYKSIKLWSLYADLEESLGTPESTYAVYERIIDLRIATPQIIINYGMLLQEHNNFEKSFTVYERGVKIFKYPRAKDIWVIYISSFVAYLSKFDEKYRGIKVERARDIFERAIEAAPAESAKPLFLEYVKLEEQYGGASRVMRVYKQAIETVPSNEKMGMYTTCIQKALEICSIPMVRKIFEEAINGPELEDEDVKAMCLKYAKLENRLGEIARVRALYKHAAQFADPRSDDEVWKEWVEFELQHGNEETVQEMGQLKRKRLE